MNLMYCRRYLIPVVILLISLMAAGCASKPKLISIPEAKVLVEAYHASDEYVADVARVTKAGQRFLERTLKNSAYAKPAVVFDIDETLLSNLTGEKEMNFCFDKSKWNDWTARASAPGIQPSVQLFKWCKKKGLNIFLITGRREAQRAETEMNLKNAGLDGYTRLYLKPDTWKGASAADYKTPVREQIQKDGYVILASFGDQQSDLDGGFAIKTFKLPNYMYLVP